MFSKQKQNKQKKYLETGWILPERESREMVGSFPGGGEGVDGEELADAPLCFHRPAVAGSGRVAAGGGRRAAGG